MSHDGQTLKMRTQADAGFTLLWSLKHSEDKQCIFFFSWSNKYPLFSARSISNDSVIIWEEVYSVE